MSKSRMSRRILLQAGIAAFPAVVPRAALSANGRIRVGVIGVGTRGKLLIDQLPQEAELAAICDCDLNKCTDLIAKKQAKWSVYQDYRRLLERKDIDGVIIANAGAQSRSALHSLLPGGQRRLCREAAVGVCRGRARAGARGAQVPARGAGR